MAKEIFISYKAEEYDDAFWVKEQLEKEGLSCWMAPMDISGGTSYATEIPKAIKNCKVFVLILSRGAQESKWVPRELDQAINENKIIMPFTIKKCALQADFSFYLTNVQRYDAYLNKNSAMTSLIRDIKKHLGIKEKAPEKVPEKPAEKPLTFADLGLEEFFGQSAKVSKEEQQKPRQTQKRKAVFATPKTKMGIIAGVALAILIGVVVYIADGVTIAGERYSISNSYDLYLVDKTLTAEDVEGISKLKELSILKLQNCTFTESDLSGICGPEMIDFTLENCQLTKEQVDSLDFSNTELWSCDLSGNTNVTSFDMLEPVKDNLDSLDISGTSITDLSPLASYTKLVELYADDCGISDITALSNCINLQILSLNNNELTSLAGLENATILKYVCLSGNQLEDISILSKSAATLQRLYVGNNQLSDISVLEECNVIEYVVLDNNKITTLASLENANNLKGLSASGNKLTDTTGIEGVRNLEYLNLTNNNITVVGGTETIVFADAVGAVLDLSNNPLKTVNISYSETFNFLSLANCNISDYSFLENINGYEMVINHSDSVNYETISAKSYYDVYLIGCPLDKQIEVKGILGESVVIFAGDGEDLSQVYQIENYYNDAMKGILQY